MSHELRTPLTVIKGYVYTLQRAEGDSAKAAKLSVIDGECERLSYMIESLLELSRVRAGRVRVCEQAFALRPCVEEVAERLEAVARHQDVGIQVRWAGADATVLGDENRLRQVFANLIGNGVKYAPPGTDVVVTAHVTGGTAAVSVEDRGRGIAEADLPFIFDEFFQAPERSEPGAGLGLAIARELDRGPRRPDRRVEPRRRGVPLHRHPADGRGGTLSASGSALRLTYAAPGDGRPVELIPALARGEPHHEASRHRPPGAGCARLLRASAARHRRPLPHRSRGSRGRTGVVGGGGCGAARCHGGPMLDVGRLLVRSRARSSRARS